MSMFPIRQKDLKPGLPIQVTNIEQDTKWKKIKLPESSSSITK